MRRDTCRSAGRRSGMSVASGRIPDRAVSGRCGPFMFLRRRECGSRHGRDSDVRFPEGDPGFYGAVCEGKKPLALDTGETCADRRGEKDLLMMRLSHGLLCILCCGTGSGILRSAGRCRISGRNSPKNRQLFRRIYRIQENDTLVKTCLIHDALSFCRLISADAGIRR